MNTLTLKARVQTYKELSKSGIVALVLISVFGGYLAGHNLEAPFDPSHFIRTLLGVLFLASGSSALNQIQEIEIDRVMPRTEKRPLPSGRIHLNEAIAFVAISLLVGLGFLYSISVSVLALGLAAVFSYNFLYTLWWKKKMAFAAIPGAIPGALPILMGYAAASGSVFTGGGLYLFFILFFWQMPHFWALAIRFEEDYRQGGIPTLPVAHGKTITVKQTAIWSLGYIGIALLAPLFLRVGGFYLTVAFIVSAGVIYEAWEFAKSKETEKRWLRFFLWINFSLILLIAAIDLDLWQHTLLTPWHTR